MNDTTQPSQQNEEPKLLQLTKIEARVLGSLMEKERTTPEAYPLTLNALTTACNQKSSRSPVSSHSQGEIGHTLRQLENQGLIRTESGSRSERFSQRLGRELALNDKRQTLLCLLLLRGPQTLAELLTRSARMTAFQDLEDVRLSLLKLIERPKPLCKQMIRESGQREDRFGHTLCGEPENSTQDHSLDTPQSTPATQAGNNELATRVAYLEKAVAQLYESLGVKPPSHESEEI